MRRVMVVEDDTSVAQLLSCLLQDEGFLTEVAETGPEAMDIFDRVGAELILLDLTLPGPWSGAEVLRRLRGRSDVPVIVVTGKTDEVDRIVGLEMGADDYVTKPFSPRELLARIRAVLRRRRPERPDPVLAAGPVRIDVDRHTVTIDGEPVQLPLKEFMLLEMLVRNAGLVLPRTRILDTVWGPAYYGDTKTLDVHIKRLRAKIEPKSGKPRHLITIRGLGFKFQPGDAPAPPDPSPIRPAVVPCRE